MLHKRDLRLRKRQSTGRVDCLWKLSCESFYLRIGKAKPRLKRPFTSFLKTLLAFGAQKGPLDELFACSIYGWAELFMIMDAIIGQTVPLTHITHLAIFSLDMNSAVTNNELLFTAKYKDSSKANLFQT